MTFALIGCGNKENSANVTIDELNEINNKINEYYKDADYNVEKAKYDNVSFHYVDTTDKVVVVGLLDNSEAQQDKFEQLIVESAYIRFVHGENLTDHHNN